MFTDIVFPEKNEEAFLAMAKRLRCNVVFAYERIPAGTKENYPGIPLAAIIGKHAAKADLILGRPEDVERKDVDIICDLEGEERRDGLHERKTALNHVLCVKAREGGKLLAVDFSLLLDHPDKGLILGRMRQNAAHLQKYKNEAIIVSLARDPYAMRPGHDYLSLLSVLGYDGKEGKRIIGRLTDRIA